MFGSLGIWEILLIFLIIMVVFGAKKLPEIGRGMGKAIVNFKRSMKEPEIISDDSEENNKKEQENKKDDSEN
jgi:sec-independent protein translocase protein TatA